MGTGNAESETLQLILKLPPMVVQHLRQQVSAGVYENESEYVESLLLSDTLFVPVKEDDLVHWMNTEGARRCEAMDADPSRALSHEEAWKFLDEDDDDPNKSAV